MLEKTFRVSIAGAQNNHPLYRLFSEGTLRPYATFQNARHFRTICLSSTPSIFALSRVATVDGRPPRPLVCGFIWKVPFRYRIWRKSAAACGLWVNTCGCSSQRLLSPEYFSRPPPVGQRYFFKRRVWRDLSRHLIFLISCHPTQRNSPPLSLGLSK